MMHTAQSAAALIGCHPEKVRWLCRRYSIGTLVNRSRRELSDGDLQEIRFRVENPQSRSRSARSASGRFITSPSSDLPAALVSLREAARRVRDSRGLLSEAMAVVQGEWS